MNEEPKEITVINDEYFADGRLKKEVRTVKPFKEAIAEVDTSKIYYWCKHCGHDQRVHKPSRNIYKKTAGKCGKSCKCPGYEWNQILSRGSGKTYAKK